MRNHLIGWLATFVVAAGSLVSVPAARGDERYFMMIFAAEGTLNVPRWAHTFATFIKVTEEEDVDAAQAPLEAHTISWLPATLDVRLFFQPPEKGANLDLPGTLKQEVSQGAAVYAWGPFEIKKELYDRALAQIDRLNSGKVAYKAMDGRFRPIGATNCFHAVSDIVPGPLLDTGLAFGVPASEMVLEHLAPWIVRPSEIHRELVKRLGLKDYAIVYRSDRPSVEFRSERLGSVR